MTSGKRGDCDPSEAAPLSTIWRAFLDSLPSSLRAVHDSPLPDVFLAPDGRSYGLGELLDVLSEQVETRSDSPLRRLSEDTTAHGLLAAAWRQVAFGQARAARHLVQLGLTHEALINARACMEHAVYLRHFALARDAGNAEQFVEEVVHQARRQSERDLSYLEGLDATVMGEYRGLLTDLREATESHRNAEHPSRGRRPFDLGQIRRVFEGTSGGAQLYEIYRRLSNSTHAGLGSAGPYLAPALRTDPPLLERADSIAWAETAALLCWCCWAADEALTRFLEDGADLAARQKLLLARVGIAVSI